MSGRLQSADLILVNDWSEVPDFESEAEEAAFWGTHGLGPTLLDQMGPLDDVLPPPRRRRRRFWQRIRVPAKMAATLSAAPEMHASYTRPGRVYRNDAA
jgi:hypothetical protein